MKGSLGLAFIAIVLQLSCNAAHAVTWFDSNIRPDGVGDNNSNANAYMTPAEDTQVVYGNTQSDQDGVGDFFDSGD